MTVWENIFEKAKEVTSNASKKTGEFYELSKLKWQAIQINNEVKAIYEKLGNSVYTMVKEDCEDPGVVVSIVEEIDNLLEKLDSLNEKIAQLQKVNICTKCGSKNPIEYSYCYKCGNKLEEDIEFEENIETTGETEE